jgi:single-strand DNA-binding protein
MIRISAHGRLGQDPQSITTKSGKPMARASMACEVTPYNGETPDTEWFSIICFGRTAEDLLRCQKGNLIAVSGSLVRTRWTDKDGQEKTAWQITAEDLHASRTVRPSGGKKRGSGGDGPPTGTTVPTQRREPVPAGDHGFGDDDIPW